MTMPPDEARTYTAATSAYVVFVILFGIPMSFLVVGCVIWPQRSIVMALLSYVPAAGLAFVWLQRFRIDIDSQVIAYRSLTQQRTLKIDDIESIKFSMEPFANPWGPTVRLTLTSRTGGPPLVINAKVFSREAIRDIQSLAPTEPSHGLLDRLLPR